MSGEKIFQTIIMALVIGTIVVSGFNTYQLNKAIEAEGGQLIYGMEDYVQSD